MHEGPPEISVHILQNYDKIKCQYLYIEYFILQYIVVGVLCISIVREVNNMANSACLEALDISIIRNILRSMSNEHWSVSEALDEYDIPDYLREEYEALLEKCFID